MAITYDNSAQGAVSGNFTLSYTVGTGAKFLALAFNYNSGITAITYNGVAPTSGTELNDSSVRLWMYYWLAPAEGAHDFSVTFASTTAFQGGALAISLIGVSQTNPLGAAVDAYQEYIGSTVTDLDIVLGSSGSWVLEAQATDVSQSITQDDSQTERQERVTGNAGIAIATKAFTDPGTNNLGFSVAGSSGLWHVMWEVRDAANDAGNGTMLLNF